MSTHWWNEDDLVPVSSEEARRLLLDAVAVAREQGWIPGRGESTCRCLVCRSWDDYERGKVTE